MHPEKEENSYYEGDPLPFFHLLPKASFWSIRIVWEPLFIIVATGVLERIFIFQSTLAFYLDIAAFALAMKSFIDWYQSWAYIRDVLDAQFAGPAIGRLIDNSATDTDREKIHLASFPKDLPDDVRQDALLRIAEQIRGGRRTA